MGLFEEGLPPQGCLLLPMPETEYKEDLRSSVSGQQDTKPQTLTPRDPAAFFNPKMVLAGAVKPLSHKTNSLVQRNNNTLSGEKQTFRNQIDTQTLSPNSNPTEADVPNQNDSKSSLIHKLRKRSLTLLTFRSKRARRIDATLELASGMAFAKRLLKWRLMPEGYSAHLTLMEQRLALRQAFRRWSEVVPIDFQEDLTASMSEIDIKLGFGTGRHLGCPQVFDGAWQELAHSLQHGDIHFDDNEAYSTSDSHPGVSLLKVAVHEIGHVLGLPHLLRPGSVMHPYYSPTGSTVELDSEDRRAIQQLYGVCEGPFDTVFDWVWRKTNQQGEPVIRFNTYFFRKGWYWLYENRNNRSRSRDPREVRSGWQGIPVESIDVFIHVWTRYCNAAYFFKGTQYWRYDSENDQAYTEDPQGHRYPRRISQGFPGISGPVDTAFFHRRDHCIYFFRGHMVTVFNVSSNQRLEGFPRRILEVFPASVPGDHPIAHLDAAYYSYSHQALFLLKGLFFWQVAGAQDRSRDPSLPHNALLPHRRVAEQWRDICDVHSSILTYK
ncbi:matrix metalloproteinase-21-like [Acipenser ruthenus]|uniref:matrix metalloproteinase-21-like n=1 Tax=Acipenser ruthenus TaxID=7906 RepID=UPI0027407F66|nr:matrix metalloproteinase-21-like [Acipenser ruthenus]